MATAVFAIAMGLVTNTLGKVVVATVGGGPRFGLALGALFLPVAAAIAVPLATDRLSRAGCRPGTPARSSCPWVLARLPQA